MSKSRQNRHSHIAGTLHWVCEGDRHPINTRLDLTMLDFDSNVLRTRLKILMLVTKQQMDATKFGSRMLKNGL